MDNIIFEDHNDVIYILSKIRSLIKERGREVLLYTNTRHPEIIKSNDVLLAENTQEPGYDLNKRESFTNITEIKGLKSRVSFLKAPIPILFEHSFLKNKTKRREAVMSPVGYKKSIREMAVENFDVHVINEQLLIIMKLDGQEEIINA